MIISEDSAQHTFLVFCVLLEGDVAEVQNGRHDSKQISFLGGTQADAVHGVSEVRELLLVLEVRVMEGSWVEVLGGEGGEGGEGRDVWRNEGNIEGVYVQSKSCCVYI